MKRVLACLLGAATLLLGSAVAAVAPAPPNDAWKPVITPFGQVFPSLLIATANMPADAVTTRGRVLGDTNGVIGAEVVARRDGERVKLAVRMPTLARDSTLEATLPQAGGRYALYPTIQWDFERLARLRQPGPDTIEFTLHRDDEPPSTRAERVRVRSINDAPYYVADGKSTADLNWMFAAYVNEDHPLADSILKEALLSGIVDGFDGYQSGDPAQVYRQVFAVWNVLQRRGIRYSSITRTSAPGDKVLSQHVRFLDQSWNNSQANCVDGSVLLASILRKIDLNPSLVLVPGHMFLAFDLDGQGRQRAYLETTLLGEVERRGNGQLRGLADGLVGDVDEATSLNSFEAAAAKGTAAYRSAYPGFSRGDDPEYQIIDIDAARKLGVSPIGYRE
jgi:hypothetical protein